MTHGWVACPTGLVVIPTDTATREQQARSRTDAEGRSGRVGVPFAFEPEDYAQIITDIAERLGPELGWAGTIRQRWSVHAANGHGGNVELKGPDPSTFRFSLLRVFDPSTPTAEINIAESHYKLVLDSRVPHGLNRV